MFVLFDVGTTSNGIHVTACQPKQLTVFAFNESNKRWVCTGHILIHMDCVELVGGVVRSHCVIELLIGIPVLGAMFLYCTLLIEPYNDITVVDTEFGHCVYHR